MRVAIKPTFYTFGGDRETFNFSDPINYLNIVINNDVMRFCSGNVITGVKQRTFAIEIKVNTNPVKINSNSIKIPLHNFHKEAH